MNLYAKKVILLGNGNSLNQLINNSIIHDRESVSIGLSLSTLHEFDADFYYSESPSEERYFNDVKYFQKYFNVRRKAIELKAKNPDTKFIFDESCSGNIHDNYSGINFEQLRYFYLGHINMRLKGSNRIFGKIIDFYITLQQIGLCSRNVSLGNFSLFRLLQICVMHRAKEIHLVGFDLAGPPFYKYHNLVSEELNINIQFILDYQKNIHSDEHRTNDPSVNAITADHVIQAFDKICQRRGIKLYLHKGEF
ncbi:hypothetical protein N9B62_00250 [Amylibacter sp.]|nr:hypothetical protein [Amylibacter sp.]